MKNKTAGDKIFKVKCFIFLKDICKIQAKIIMLIFNILQMYQKIQNRPEQLKTFIAEFNHP